MPEMRADTSPTKRHPSDAVGAGHCDGDELLAGADPPDVDARHGWVADGVARAFDAEARSGVRSQVGEGCGTAASRGPSRGGCPNGAPGGKLRPIDGYFHSASLTRRSGTSPITFRDGVPERHQKYVPVRRLTGDVLGP